jgi:hypothetical protein
MRREKNAKICLPLGITTKSDFVFTRPRPLTSFTALQECGGYRRNSGQTAPSGMTVSAALSIADIPLSKGRPIASGRILISSEPQRLPGALITRRPASLDPWAEYEKRVLQMKIFVAVWAFVGLLLTGTVATAQPAKPTIVLVHGAFAYSSSWYGVDHNP